MKYFKKYWRLILVATIFAAVGGAGTAYYSASTQAKKVSGIQEVSLVANEAKPSVLFVKVGESVQFNSRDGKDHYIGSGRGEAGHDTHDADTEKSAHEHTEGINSGQFGPDEGYRVRFSKVGTYEFHDHLNPSIRITVVVYQPEKS